MTRVRKIGGGSQIRAGLSGYVAEMAGAFVCAALGIVPSVRHADYIGSWLEIIREDHRAILRAASAASKAADYLLAFRPGAAAPAAAASVPSAASAAAALPVSSASDDDRAPAERIAA